ncbi:MAG: reverse transcriptase/maturase family protein [bacterium]|nr:reverse transcriptase/maturase family protein [bacterium]
MEAWGEFEAGKRDKLDVQRFSLHLFDNLFELQQLIATGQYRHGPYERFVVSDPKKRIIHKASVRDRVLHRALYRLLYPFFDRTFIADSYSCRVGKGTHLSLDRFTVLARRASHNHKHTVWVLKGDIRKFFASINHAVLLALLWSHIPDRSLRRLLATVVESFSTLPGTGLPLGNLTSQLFCNVYLNQFDQFVKHKLKAEYYQRYADDFVIMSCDKSWLEQLLPLLEQFLWERLRLQMHPDKVWIKTVASGVDFLGWVHFPYHRVLRQSTKRRMLAAVAGGSVKTMHSYLGMLTHGNALKLTAEVETTYYLFNS